MVSEERRPREAALKLPALASRLGSNGATSSSWAGGRGAQGSMGDPSSSALAQAVPQPSVQIQCCPLPDSCQMVLPSCPQVQARPSSRSQPSGIAMVAAAQLVFVRLPSAVSTRELMTRRMMDCKYPANGSLLPGPGPSEPTEMFPLDWDGQEGAWQHCQGSCVESALGIAPFHSGGGVLWMIPRKQPHCRGSRERGQRKTADWEETTGGLLLGHWHLAD